MAGDTDPFLSPSGWVKTKAEGRTALGMTPALKLLEEMKSKTLADIVVLARDS